LTSAGRADNGQSFFTLPDASARKARKCCMTFLRREIPAPWRYHVSEFTHVELVWFKKRIENSIRFGRTAEEHVLDRNLRIVSFAPDSIFAFVRWVSNDDGASVSRIDILRAVGSGECYSTIPYVRPGGELLLHLFGWPKVEKVLQAIDGVERLGINPADASPQHWRHVHNRLSVGEQPRPYTRSQHRVWLCQRKLAP
jgi:hypothetical protein